MSGNNEDGTSDDFNGPAIDTENYRPPPAWLVAMRIQQAQENK